MKYTYVSEVRMEVVAADTHWCGEHSSATRRCYMLDCWCEVGTICPWRPAEPRASQDRGGSAARGIVSRRADSGRDCSSALASRITPACCSTIAC